MCALFKPKDMGIDLGTANTLIYLKGAGIVLNEPSVIATDKDGNVIAFGKEAKEMIGKEPKNISVIRPLRDGVISDFDSASVMLQKLLGKALSEKRIRNFRVAVGVPSGVTEVEKRAVNEAVRGMGANEVYIIEEPMAAAIGAGMPIDGNVGCMIADIGGGTTDVAILDIGGVVSSTSIRHAGDKMNEAIISYMKMRYNLLIGEQMAENIKINIGCATHLKTKDGDDDVRTMLAKGRDILSGLPKTVEVTSLEIQTALEESIELIIDAIKETVEKAPPETAADIVDVGMVLSGGGGMLRNLDKLIEERTGMKVKIAEDPYTAVAVGTGKSLEDIEKLKHYVHARNHSFDTDRNTI